MAFGNVKWDWSQKNLFAGGCRGMSDMSHLDAKYFVDGDRYNCPFCNRRHVVYQITTAHEFDWTGTRRCQVVFIRCTSCGKESMHLSYAKAVYYDGRQRWSPDVDQDAIFFYSVPRSFHVMDTRIPRELRELLDEAAGCQKSNFLTGASACARKLVYELAVRLDAAGDNYEDRIKSLKAKLPQIDPAYFDTLLTIQQVTSDKVHENSYDGWEARHLRLILVALVEILNEVYVTPQVREERRRAMLSLKDEVLSPKPLAMQEGSPSSE